MVPNRGYMLHLELNFDMDFVLKEKKMLEKATIKCRARNLTKMSDDTVNVFDSLCQSIVNVWFHKPILDLGDILV